MVKIRKYANFIERFLHGPGGQRFFNFAYSIGAAIVIWGALFKILHLPGGNLLLCIGMGTEIAMFILTAFDRPPKEYAWEEVFPVLDSKNPDERPDFKSGSGIIITGDVVAGDAQSAPTDGQIAENTAGGGFSGIVSAGVPATGIISGGGAAVGGTAAATAAPIPAEEAETLHQSILRMTEQMDRLQETTRALNEVSETLLQSYKAITDNSDNISQSALGYAEQMADLNRNLNGLNTIYEIQLKHVSGQLDNIDRVNRGLKDIRDMYEKSANESSRYCEESEKMARYMQQINSVYEKMITAMTIGMHNPMMGQPGANPFVKTDRTDND
ncbi:gliding motility protein GldL [Lepagella muris]|jgi:gliding motility-associated protein GldL|uniref:Gliding motility protein GldL n=1 Tax=Lepagella muris TaxID=3032870 RepID=A0AC61RKD8_9BACT|nr:gliding motility protein GldL [Lepagella muris]ROT06489.1 gliding motility protein GldL [Muribaculaceae bacterium Isolate-037 (Harlan)]TGY80808.1 gliding motility protein GldL [Lepagella muris]THG53886.1 gliding motility protein GldL [Bacteroidales bacterium]TKC59738.1 gliding motility protein GldL [Bacteroidales bacterium]